MNFQTVTFGEITEEIKMVHSKYQTRIFKEVEETNNSIIVAAVAGSGKTTTIVDCVKRVPKSLDKIFLAFNNQIVEELKERIQFPNTTVTTMHSFAWKNLIRSKNGNVKLDKGKSIIVIKKLFKKHKIESKKQGFFMYAISKLVDMYRHNLSDDYEDFIYIGGRYDIEVTDQMKEMAIEVLELMDKDNKTFDFTDMLYRAIKDNVRLPKFDLVFVDEAQDLSKLQQAIVSKIRKRSGRLIAVGDPMQAIYGFAGADSNSYNNLKNLFPNTVELPLSVNYRCGKSIVEEAKKINPLIEPFHLNKTGVVSKGFCRDIKQEDWVICRNLKPLIIMNLYLLERGVRSFIKGVDLGHNIEKYVLKFGSQSLNTVNYKIGEDIDKEVAKLYKKGLKNPMKTEGINKMLQRRDIVKVLSKNISSTKEFISRLRGIFKEQKHAVTLSTIHKSKGLENDNIFFLCPELIPSEYAEQPWQVEQEYNLMYVGITRAKKKLIYIEKSHYSVIEKKILKKIENKDED